MDIQTLREQQKLDAIILFSPGEILAATGHFVDNACLIADNLGITVICPEGAVPARAAGGSEGAVADPAGVCPEDAPATAALRWFEYPQCGFDQVQDAQQNLWAAVQHCLLPHRHIGYVRYTCPAALMTLPLPSARFSDISCAVAEAMLCKNEVFFQKYAQLKQLNIRAYEHIRTAIHAGCSELELSAAVREAYVKDCDGQVLYTGDFLSGPRTCSIGGPATGRVIRNGDTIIADTLCACEGVYCDTTRSFFCGEPDRAQRQAYETLCHILEETALLLRPGTAARDIYQFVSRRLESEGYAPLPHHAGHGLGYGWYEAPYLIADDTTILKENMLIALEPGIYIPESFGLRLENNYRVTGNGGVDVFCYKQDIQDFII